MVDNGSDDAIQFQIPFFLGSGLSKGLKMM